MAKVGWLHTIVKKKLYSKSPFGRSFFNLDEVFPTLFIIIVREKVGLIHLMKDEKIRTWKSILGSSFIIWVCTMGQAAS